VTVVSARTVVGVQKVLIDCVRDSNVENSIPDFLSPITSDTGFMDSYRENGSTFIPTTAHPSTVPST